MSPRSSRPAAGKKASGLYVYCIGEYEGVAPLLKENLPDPVEADGELLLVRSDGLAAVASPVQLSEYSEETMDRNLADPAWMAVRAMRHEKVVEHFALRASIIPVRFGTIYHSQSRVQEILRKRSSEFQKTIEYLRGKEEWGLNIYGATEKLLKAASGSSARLRTMDRKAKSSSAGQAYLLRKKIESLRAEEVRQEVKRVVAEVGQKLSEVSAEMDRLTVVRREQADYGTLVGRLVFLVERSSFRKFQARAEQVARRYSAAGFHFELTGPWPAYNFVKDIPDIDESEIKG